MRFHRRAVRVCVLLGVACVVLSGCTSGPNLIETWRPWTSNFGELEQIQPGSTCAVSIASDMSPFVGDQSLREGYLKGVTEDFLRRKGFVVTDENANYQLQIHLRTTEEERVQYGQSGSNVNVSNTIEYSSYSSGDGSASTVSEVAAIAAVGVLIATLIANSTEPDYPEVSGSYTNYTHSVNISLKHSSGETVWQGDAHWQTSTQDIAANWPFVVQTMLCEFPQKENVLVEVPRLKEGRIKTYYDMYCRDQWFTSPGVPYRIAFSEYRSIVNNQEAYPAYVDLLSHANIALPTGCDDFTGPNDFSDPTDRNLWWEISIGGRYALGELKEPVNVIIDLKANKKSGGYSVRRARLVSEEEFRKFESRIRSWQHALSDYYTVFD